MVATKKRSSMPDVNPEAERAVLGALLIAGDDHTVSDPILAPLEEDDFYEPRHALVFRAIKDLHAAGKPPVPVLVDEWLKNSGDLATVKQVYVHELANTCESAYYGLHYAEIVLKNSLGRKKAAIGNDLQLGKISENEAIQQLEALGHRQDTVGVGPFTLEELMREELPPLKQVVPGLIVSGLTLLASKMKIGKSWLALALAIGVASGGVVLGKPVEQGDVLYLALEDGKRRLQSRARKLLGDAPIPRGLTIDTKWERFSPKAGGLAHLERWLRTHPRTRLVIVDVWAKVAPPRSRNGDAYAEDYAAMTALKALADRYDTALVVIHHTRKVAADDVFDEINGTTGIAGACDTLLILQRPRNEENGTLHVTGRDIETEEQLALRFDKTTCVWSIMSDEDVQRAKEEALSTQRKAILKAVRELGSGTPKEIALKMGQGSRYNTIKNVILDMARDDQLVRQGDGRYSEPSPPDPETDTTEKYKQGSLSSLSSLDGDGAGNVGDLGDGAPDYHQDNASSLSSLAAENIVLQTTQTTETDHAVVSRNGHQIQAPTPLAALQTTQTTETTTITSNGHAPAGMTFAARQRRYIAEGMSEEEATERALADIKREVEV